MKYETARRPADSRSEYIRNLTASNALLGDVRWRVFFALHDHLIRPYAFAAQEIERRNAVLLRRGFEQVVTP